MMILFVVCYDVMFVMMLVAFGSIALFFFSCLSIRICTKKGGSNRS